MERNTANWKRMVKSLIVEKKSTHTDEVEEIVRLLVEAALQGGCGGWRDFS